MTTDNFLVEIGTEELPPKALKSLEEAFRQGIIARLTTQKLDFSEVRSFATPRRLAILVKALQSKQPDNQVEQHGPPVSSAFDSNGNPTKSAEGFARRHGVTVADLQQVSTPKGERLAFKTLVEGKSTVDLLPTIVDQSLADLPIPKRMRWGSSTDEFVRPVHWVVMLFGNRVVTGKVLGLTAGNETAGHRFHCDEKLVIPTPHDYQQLLRNSGKVIVDFEERKSLIKDQVNAEAGNIGGKAVIDDALLDEVTSLVEWPVALTGKFDEQFLDVPVEALISSMKEHQKYFHVVDANDALLPNFITVANIISKDPSQVISGNERVIRPRLSDAAFFFATDKKQSLENRRSKLETIIFQAQLGSVADKTLRVAKLASHIATVIGSDATLANRAALLSKSDLATEMVLEFSDLQGIMGYYYALNDNEHEDVAKALREQYMPRFAGDQLPSTTTGIVLALADRIDTLVGIFGIGQPPSGSKDPFALRRASLGVLRIIVEKQLTLDLHDCLTLASDHYGSLINTDNLVDSVFSYMIERFRAWYEDEDVQTDIFMAVAAKQLTQPYDINRRVHAVQQFSKLAEAKSLATANKRVSNILAKNNIDLTGEQLNPSLFESTDEKDLATMLATKAGETTPLISAGDYAQALAALASLKDPIDNFFDNVMVMVDDKQVRTNRLILLNHLRTLFLEVADISLLAPAK